MNLAAQAGVRYSITNPNVYIESNLIGFYNILEACRKYPVSHLVHEGIVSRELWDKVQTMRQIHRQQMDAGVYIKKSCHPLYGKVFCGTCGRPCCRRIVRNHDGSKEATWVCVDRFKGHRGNGCMNPIAKEKHILKAMREKNGSENPALVERILLCESYEIYVT